MIRNSLSAALLPLLLAGAAVAQQPAPDLTGSVVYEVGSRNGTVQRVMVTVGDGGSGPYPAVLSGDTTLPSHTIYRPRDLSPFGAGNRLPIVAWASGACANHSGEVRNFLSEIASHGFLIVAIGPAAYSAVLGGGVQVGATRASQLTDAIDWAIAQGRRAGGEYYQKVDTARIAVMGHSCGGVQALDVSKDPRITTTLAWNSGVLSAPMAAPPAPPAPPPGAGPAPAAAPPSSMVTMTKARLSELHGPVAYFIGGPSDIAHANAVDDFQRIDHVPVFMANRDVGHYPATFREPRGGAFAVAGTAWLKWQLKGDQAAARMFVGADCGLCRDPSWTVRQKNLR